MPEETAPVDSIIVALWTMRHVPRIAASLDPSATALALEIRLAIGQKGWAWIPNAPEDFDLLALRNLGWSNGPPDLALLGLFRFISRR
jgi:hypothetical protein